MPSAKIQAYPYVDTAEPVYNSDGYSYYDETAEQHQAVAVEATRIPPQASTTATSFSPQVATVENQRYVNVGTRKPVMLTYCPKCNKQHVTTYTRTKATGATWLGVLVGVVVFWPLCWIPLVCKPMKQSNHHCTNCRAKIGRVKPFQ